MQVNSPELLQPGVWILRSEEHQVDRNDINSSDTRVLAVPPREPVSSIICVTIRDQQLAEIKAARIAGFETETAARLRVLYPETEGTVDDAFLRTFVRAAVRQAMGYRIPDEPTLSRFIDYSFGAYLHVTGADLVPWLDRWMKDTNQPAGLRVEKVRQALMSELESKGVG